MALKPSTGNLSPADYLSGERLSEIRHEYLDGEVYAMAGGSMNHNRISSNLVRRLGNFLDGKSCEVFSGDMMVMTGDDSYRYPDVVVDCSSSENNNQFLETPVLLIEVMSRSTRKQDKGVKRMEYLALESVLEYVLIEQDFVEIEVFRRSAGWQPTYYYLGDDIHFESLDVTLSVAEIYDRVVNDDVALYQVS